MANAGYFKKGEKKPNQGKRGPSKVTRELKEMILQALDNKGGVDYLERCAEDHPVAFMSLVGKVLPLQVKGELEHSGGITVKIQHF